MSKKKLCRLVDDLVAQGAGTRRIKSGGFLLFLPDGTTATMHLTTSDHRGLKNLRSIVEKAGLNWPVNI